MQLKFVKKYYAANYFNIFRPAGSIQVTENSFIKKLQTSGRSLVVFYGSQTGTAEEFAGRLAKEGIRYKMKGMVADPEECDMVYILYSRLYHNIYCNNKC